MEVLTTKLGYHASEPREAHLKKITINCNYTPETNPAIRATSSGSGVRL